jgi:hypothetical protein
MNNIINQVPFLRASREFPTEVSELSIVCSKTYIDIANMVNARTIGIFTVNRPILTGESWFISKNQRQQTLRQVYTFTTTTNIPHGLNLNQIDYFTRCWGTYTDGTNWYGIINGTSVAIAGELSFYISPTNIVFLVGVGAPALRKGQITLEWLSNP